MEEIKTANQVAAQVAYLSTHLYASQMDLEKICGKDRKKKPLHARTRAKILCQFCATSLQNPVILRNIPEYISPFILLILLSLFVAVFPCLPM